MSLPGQTGSQPSPSSFPFYLSFAESSVLSQTSDRVEDGGAGRACHYQARRDHNLLLLLFLFIFLLQSRLCSPRPVTELKTVEQDEHVITRPDGITTFSFFFSFLSF